MGQCQKSASTTNIYEEYNFSVSLFMKTMNTDVNKNSKLATLINRKMIGFIGATISLAAVYAASAAPIPLYNTYSQILGLTSGDLSMTAVTYFVGCVIALLMFARLSDYLGRRPVSFVTLWLAVMGCLVFFYIHNAPTILVGRFIQGFSCGLASSAVATYILDNAPVSPRWIGATVTSGAPMIGLAAGSFGSGALQQYGFGSPSLIFGILIVVLAVCAVLVAASLETVTRTKGAAASIVPQIKVPKKIHYLLPAASCTFIGTWAIGGFYQAFSSSMAAEMLGTNNPIVAAAIFACMMAPNLIGGALAGRQKPDVAQRIGMLIFLLCVIVILVSLKAGAIIPFLTATIFAAMAWGAAFTGSMRGLLDKTSQEDRAGVLSAIFLISYSGAAVPNLIVGLLPSTFTLFEIATGYVILVSATCIITLFTTRRDENGLTF
jgi:predicted MFS family arabinose efflux permease